MSSILTTHVGSLPRSKKLSELLFKKDKGDSFDNDLLEQVSSVSTNINNITKVRQRFVKN